MSSSAPGPRKAGWVTETLRSARADGVDAVVWFEFAKEADWRLSESRTAATAARATVTAPGWRRGGDLAAVERAVVERRPEHESVAGAALRDSEHLSDELLDVAFVHDRLRSGGEEAVADVG